MKPLLQFVGGSESKAFIEWYVSQFLTQTALDQLQEDNSCNGLFRNLCVNDKQANYSLLEPFTRFVDLKYGYPIPRRGFAVAVVKAFWDEKQTTIAHILWNPNTVHEDVVDNAPMYIMTSGTFVSQDGEYRNKFMKYSSKLAETYSIYDDVFDKVSKFVSFTATVYPSEMSFLAESIDTLRLLHLCYAMFAAYNITLLKQGLLMDHLLQSTKEFASFIEPYHASSVPAHVQSSMRIGMKMIPLSSEEVDKILDVQYPSWKELFVAEQASMLMINHRAMFPMLDNWSYIEGCSEGFFENQAVVGKFRVSDQAETIMNQLAKLRDNPPSDQVNARETALQIISGLMVVQNSYILSDLTLVMIMSDEGNTLANLYKRGTRSIHENGSEYWNITLSGGMFDCINAAYQLHRIGIIHGDEHANNIVCSKLRGLWKLRTEGRSADLNMYTVAITDGDAETNTYVNRSVGLMCKLIDFSRAFIGEECREALRDRGDPDFHINEILTGQANRFVDVMKVVDKDMTMRFIAELRGLATGNWEYIFPIFSCVDFYLILDAFAGSIKMFSNDNTPSEAWPCANRDDLVKRCISLKAKCKLWMIEKFTALCTAFREGSTLPRCNLAGSELIRVLFSDRLWKNSVPALEKAIPNFFTERSHCLTFTNGSLPLRWKPNNYDKFPPWARAEVIEKHLGPLRLEQVLPGDVGTMKDALGKRNDDNLRVAVEKAQDMIAGKLRNSSMWLPK